MREYKDCYVAFMDLLGFKELINTRSCEEIASIFDEIKKRDLFNLNIKGLGQQPLVSPEEIHYKVMSDSIIIFIDSSVTHALFDLILTCLYFQMRMLNMVAPVLVRGGISRGGIYYDRDVVFGQGLVNAYLLESKHAKYPRVIIPTELVEPRDLLDIDKDATTLLMGFLLQKFFDEYYSINYVIPYLTFYRKDGYDIRFENHVLKMLNSDNDSIKEKYSYLQIQIEMFKQQKEKNK